MLIIKHIKVINTALKTEMSPKALKLIKKACVQSDIPLFYKRIDAEHFITTLDEGLKFIKCSRNNVLDELILAINTSEKRKKDQHIANALYSLGRSEHCGHDALTHTNYIHLKAVNIKGCYEYLTGQITKKPISLKNCELNISKLISERINAFNGIKKDPDFYQNVYLCPDIEGKRTSHYLLGLDSEKDIASRLYRKKYGKCGFEAAFNESIKYTRESWQKIKTSLKEKLGEETTNKLLNDLLHWNPAEVSIYKARKIFYKAVLSHILF